MLYVLPHGLSGFSNCIAPSFLFYSLLFFSFLSHLSLSFSISFSPSPLSPLALIRSCHLFFVAYFPLLSRFDFSPFLSSCSFSYSSTLSSICPSHNVCFISLSVSPVLWWSIWLAKFMVTLKLLFSLISLSLSLPLCLILSRSVSQKRHRSSDSAASGRDRSHSTDSAELLPVRCKEEQEICSAFMQQYVQYLQSLGFILVQVRPPSPARRYTHTHTTHDETPHTHSNLHFTHVPLSTTYIPWA